MLALKAALSIRGPPRHDAQCRASLSSLPRALHGVGSLIVPNHTGGMQRVVPSVRLKFPLWTHCIPGPRCGRYRPLGHDPDQIPPLTLASKGRQRRDRRVPAEPDRRQRQWRRPSDCRWRRASPRSDAASPFLHAASAFAAAASRVEPTPEFKFVFIASATHWFATDSTLAVPRAEPPARPERRRTRHWPSKSSPPIHRNPGVGGERRPPQTPPAPPGPGRRRPQTRSPTRPANRHHSRRGGLSSSEGILHGFPYTSQSRSPRVEHKSAPTCGG